MHQFRVLLLAVIGLALAASGGLLAVFSAAIEGFYNNPSLGIVAHRGGSLIAIVGACLVIIAYLEQRRNKDPKDRA